MQMINENTPPTSIPDMDKKTITNFIEDTIKMVIKDYESFNTREEVLAIACIALLKDMKKDREQC